MARSRSSFVCQQCNYESGKWLGKCPECGEWNSLVETVVSTKVQRSLRAGGKIKDQSVGKKPIRLSSVKLSATRRTKTKISELDRVLGGGIVPGQVMLVAGEPGIGKSTILLQVADRLTASRLQTTAKTKKAVDSSQSTVVYVSGEESVNQIAIRARRLGIKNKNIQLLEETDMDSVIDSVGNGVLQMTDDRRPTTLIIDSIQTMRTQDLSGMAGSVGQVRECTYRLVRFAKANNIPVFIVGHVTKQGSVAGPAVLMHLVDTVLWFEGDQDRTLRLLRAVKNRFGPTDEVGIFSMEEKGLQSMGDSEKLFLTKTRKLVPGSVVASMMKGTRPILIEVQSLVVPTKLAFPKRNAQGYDSKRLEMLIAVLTRRCSLPIYEFDCFVNVTGGINLRNDTSADLAVCLSIASAYFDKPVAKGTVAIGEVGLLGDIREVNSQDKRIKDARRLGYKHTINSTNAKYLQQAIKTYVK